jgi:hypothetical protein
MHHDGETSASRCKAAALLKIHMDYYYYRNIIFILNNKRIGPCFAATRAEVSEVSL